MISKDLVLYYVQFKGNIEDYGRFVRSASPKALCQAKNWQMLEQLDNYLQLLELMQADALSKDLRDRTVERMRVDFESLEAVACLAYGFRVDLNEHMPELSSVKLSSKDKELMNPKPSLCDQLISLFTR